MDWKLVFVLITALTGTFAGPTTSKSGEPKCGYDACPKLDPNKYHIHLVPHTHDDVGWLKTAQQYYYGRSTFGVQYILDTVVRELQANPNRRFIYVETAFFWMWWKEQTPETRQVVKDLVNSGRLEFISAGWSMNDEASVHYNSVVDHMTWGHRRLSDLFGKCATTKIGWQIDPFGHSKEYASLIAQMYMDGLFFARIDHDDKTLRQQEKRMEFIWKTSEDLGASSHLLTGVFPNLYKYPHKFDFEWDDPIIDNPESEEYNAKKRVDEFFTEIEKYTNNFDTNHFMTTFGTDFRYQNAVKNFKNIDLLMKHVNERQVNGSKYNIFYSTPTCYLKALHEANKTWTSKSDDFFPYSSDAHSFWTGYFTSRPALKRQERATNAFLQLCKHAQAFARLTDNVTEEAVASLKEAMGIAQHHDAVSGTEKQHVANDYALQLNKGVLKCQNVISKGFDKLTNKKKDGSPITFCPALNISECEITEKKGQIAVILYNPRSKPVSKRISIPWTSTSYDLKDSDGQDVISDIVPISDAIAKLPERKGKTTHEIVFTANIPPMGISTYFVNRKSKIEKHKARKVVTHQVSTPNLQTEFEGKEFKALFDDKGIVGVKIGNKVINIKQNFLYYKGATHGRSSGAYIFRPNGTEAIPFAEHKKNPIILKEKVISEFRQTINDWVSQTIRVSKDSKFIEFDYVVGPIDVGDNVGKEIISRFETDLKNGKTFYTDANGRQLVERVKDHRDTYKYNSSIEPVTSNYYPVNSRILIKDEKANLQLTVLTDRSQGGSGLTEGSVELMVHRRLLHDDGFGVGEALNEPGADGKGLIIRGRHRIFIGSIEDSIIHRDEAITEYLEPQVLFRPYVSIDDYKSRFLVVGSLVKDVPKNVHILTLESWKEGSILLRLEHFYQSHDDPNNLSKPVTVNLRDLFTTWEVKSAVETTLSANQLLKEAKRFQWKTVDSAAPSGGGYQPSLNENDLTVTLKPMEIRTFILTINEKH